MWENSHSFRHYPYRALRALLLALLLVPVARAEFFWRLPKTSETTLTQLGGTQLYTTEVSVNGAPGNLAAYLFEAPPTTISVRLARELGLPTPTAARRATWLTHRSGANFMRIIVLPTPATPDACVALALDQNLKQAARSREVSPPWPKNLPQLAAEPLFSAVCYKTRTTLVTARTTATPIAALQEATAVLRSANWQEASPGSATLKIFTAGKKQALLFAAANSDGATIITLLQREGTARAAAVF